MDVKLFRYVSLKGFSWVPVNARCKNSRDLELIGN